MRLDPKLVHPSLFKATDAYTMSGGAGVDPKVVAAHQTLWMREYGVGCAGAVLGTAAILGITVSALHTLGVPSPVRLLVMFTLMFATLALGSYGFMRHLRRLSVAELESMLPALDLSDNGRAYAETIVALHRSGRPASEIAETMAALNALLDEEARLQSLRAQAVGRDSRDVLAALDAERAALAAKADASADPGAQDAYEQSISLLDERIAGLRGAGAGLERIEAHLALLRQAVLATRDAARRLGTAPALGVPDFATDSLRAAVALARAQTQATERALAELNAI